MPDLKHQARKGAPRSPKHTGIKLRSAYLRGQHRQSYAHVTFPCGGERRPESTCRMGSVSNSILFPLTEAALQASLAKRHMHGCAVPAAPVATVPCKRAGRRPSSGISSTTWCNDTSCHTERVQFTAAFWKHLRVSAADHPPRHHTPSSQTAR